jgi:hypothetical protein
VQRTEQRDGAHDDDRSQAKQEPVLNPRQQAMLEPLKRCPQGRDLGVQVVAHWSSRIAERIQSVFAYGSVSRTFNDVIRFVAFARTP